jgi:hypothetical protein
VTGPIAERIHADIVRLVGLQTSLIGAFQVLFPNVRDWKWMLDSPTRGELESAGETWRFQKHGSGLRFVSTSGVIVDIHREVDRPGTFDEWRLSQFIESLDTGTAPKLRETGIEQCLAELVRAGTLVRVDGGALYQLAV